MSFTLSPPLLVRNQTSFAILQPSDEDIPEPLVIMMAGWSGLDILNHWRREIEMLLNGTRDRCCIVSGLSVIDDITVPSEWWIMYLINEQAKLRYQALLVHSPGEWLDPSSWWKNISPRNVSREGEAPASEWSVARRDLVRWCTQCDVLACAISATEAD
jgi:hypothetical protein